MRKPRAYQIRVALRGIRPPIWRRLEIPSELTLEEFHRVIQIAFGWTNSHLFEFEIGGRLFGLTDTEVDARELADDSVLFATKVGSVLSKTIRATYTYDVGDNWVHEIEVEREIPVHEARPFAVCVAGNRIGPPEDCGGPPGFRRFLRSLESPSRAKELYATEDLDSSSINESLRSLDVTLPPFERGSAIGDWPTLP